MFEFMAFDCLTDGVIDVRLEQQVAPNYEKGYAPTYKFFITLHDSLQRIGVINVRIGFNERLYYVGNIGYAVDEKFRGNYYAARACEIVKQVALAHGMERLIITCNPDNIPSRKTCEIVGLKLVEIVDIPQDHNLYQIGERQKCIYEWVLN